MEKSYDLKQLEELSGGSNGFVIEIVSAFLSEVPEQVENIKTSFNENNFDELTRIAHMLKPSIDLLGINAITKDIRTIEGYSKNGTHINELSNLIINVQTILNKTTEELKSDFKL